MVVSLAHRQLDLSADQILRFVLQLPASSYPVLLDSCRYHHYGLYDGRYLIAAHSPTLCLQAMGDETYEFSREQEQIMHGGALARLDELLAEWRPKDSSAGSLKLPGADGAAIGLFAYDLGRYFERLPTYARPSYAAPDMFVCFYPALIVHDYLTEKTTLVCTDTRGQAEARLLAAQAEIEHALERLPNFPLDGQQPRKQSFSYSSNFTRENYLRAVERIKWHIRAGDIYQANLTQQFRIELGTLAPETIFLRLRSQFPVPFAAYMKTPDWAVVSASPERFLRRLGTHIEAYPIKGTRPRGASAAEDARLAEELKTSEKDVAENIMIVDLLRNDLGRVAEIGSIDANELLSVQALPIVFHLVSKVSGRLRPDVTLSRLLAATFPPGSITGAPKIRAMEIIEEIEGVRRGFSMGAIGWLGYNGDLDLNVAIRTLFISGGCGYLNVGGAVVADSDPIGEYEESRLKAQALFQAIGLKF